MHRFVLLAFLLLLSFCRASANTAPQTGPQLLQIALAYQNLKGNWKQQKTCLHLSSADTAGKVNAYALEIGTTTGYFAQISRQNSYPFDIKAII